MYVYVYGSIPHSLLSTGKFFPSFPRLPNTLLSIQCQFTFGKSKVWGLAKMFVPEFPPKWVCLKIWYLQIWWFIILTPPKKRPGGTTVPPGCGTIPINWCQKWQLWLYPFGACYVIWRCPTSEKILSYPVVRRERWRELWVFIFPIQWGAIWSYQLPFPTTY